MKNWKTNIFGCILILFAVALFYIDRPIEAGVCIATAGGFFNTKDNTTTGVGINARTENEINKEREGRQ